MPIPPYVTWLRERVGSEEILLPGVTAVIRREGPHGVEVLFVRRWDTGAWTPVMGVIEPYEEPAVTAVREAREEACVEIRVDRLALVRAGDDVVYDNGDKSVYLALTFACTWLSGEARVGDDESSEVAWFPVTDLPDLTPRLRERVDAGLSDDVATRFLTAADPPL